MVFLPDMSDKPRLPFTLDATCPGTSARATTFTTLHGTVRTPVFMPVGTQASVRGLHPDILKGLDSQVLLANTYHLLLRPGPEVFERFGGIHRFMSWDRPVLTDSGGFQIFSLPHSRNMTEEYAKFRSYVDGREYLLSPETSIATQRSINSDIMMVLDQCIPATATWAEAKAAMDLTHRWALRSKTARGDSRQALFGIVQGACHPDLRKASADFLAAQDFDGLAIGGLAVGESKEQRDDFTALTSGFLPHDKPRYLMGVGTPLDILEAVHRGVDMFDCILPVALAHRGTAFTSQGKLQLRRTVYKFDQRGLDPECSCDACTRFSRAYLHHLIKADELLGWQLVSIHNLNFYHRLTESMRSHIIAGTFPAFYQDRRGILDQEDLEYPAKPAHSRLPRHQRQSRLGDYEIVQSSRPEVREGDSADNPADTASDSTRTSWASIRQISSGEIMHSVSDPLVEARELYVDQPGLPTLLSLRGQKTDLVVWDVGLGAATNAMAAVRAAEELIDRGEQVRRLHLVSFERDLDPLRLASRHASRFPHLQHPSPTALLRDGRWDHPSGFLSWELREGDFLARYPESPVPDLIWYDPFSWKTDAPLWQEEVFRGIRAHCLGEELGQRGENLLPPQGSGIGSGAGALPDSHPGAGNRSGPSTSLLFTYSASTMIRVRLLCAGFHVAAGKGTGPKSETTIASTRPFEPGSSWATLGQDWLGRWKRSHARYPDGADESLKTRIDSAILGHPQFNTPG